ncbi:hypothetical protein LIER_43631 [Lithospermum erythrorhizon]|uniref:Uncharacterized protein n=1 Tax=Lithospermum erythrorhizon TaxID=34254 RepID=A0AAV3QG86_LITER
MKCTNLVFNDGSHMWDWQGEDCYFVDNADFNGSNSQSNESTQRGNISYARDGETTPVKGMTDHAYFVDNIENKNKRQSQWSDPCSQSKRRRVLQFDSEVINGRPCTDEENSSILMTSNVSS